AWWTASLLREKGGVNARFEFWDSTGSAPITTSGGMATANTRISFSKPKSRRSGETAAADQTKACATSRGTRGSPNDHTPDSTARLMRLKATGSGTAVPKIRLRYGAPAAAVAMITVHHLDNSRSHRVLWLLEELGIPYEIKQYKREPSLRAP